MPSRTETKTGPPAVSGATLVGIAMEDIGHAYIWGQWDCSGAMNHWLSKAGQPIPGYGPGKFRGPPPHGPVVAQYAVWSGASSIPTSQAEGGDLCVWPGLSAGGHIGMCIGMKPQPKYGFPHPVLSMVSALDTNDGTVETPVHGFGPNGVPLVIRRLHGVAPGSGAIVPPGGCGTLLVASLTGIGVIPWMLKKTGQ